MLTLINDGIDLFFSDDVSGTLGKSPSVPLQESNPRPSDYAFGFSTSELQETRGSENIVTRKYSEEIRVPLCRSRTHELPITSSRALPLSYRRLVAARDRLLEA